MALINRCFLNQTLKAKRYFSVSKYLKREMPDPLELITGMLKKEITARMQGNKDPFYMKVVKRGSGTKENPTLIPSAFEGRIVGCICKDNRFVNYMWVEKDWPKRCECGHWYKLKTIEKL